MLGKKVSVNLGDYLIVMMAKMMPSALRVRDFLKGLVLAVLCVCAPLTEAASGSPGDHGSKLSAALSSLHAQRQPGHDATIPKDLAHQLYLENVTLIQKGANFIDRCKNANKNNHQPLPVDRVPFTLHEGITIIGSPYFSTPVATGKDNNAVYFARLQEALKVIERETPDVFASIRRQMREYNGYLAIGNFCPKNGGLTLGAFVPMKPTNQFAVLISSTLLLLPDMFNAYDIAAILVHEIEGHGADFYRRGVTDELNAFKTQAAFAHKVGDDKFLDVNNRSYNLETKLRLKLSTTGTYTEAR